MGALTSETGLKLAVLSRSRSDLLDIELPASTVWNCSSVFAHSIQPSESSW
jgi:hypothetical protein